MKRKLLLLFCMISCLCMMTGCTLVKENKNFKKSSLAKQTEQFAQSWFSADFASTIQQFESQMDSDTLDQYKEYEKQQKRYKGIKKFLDKEYTITSDSATVTETILCENGEKVLFSLSFAEDGSIQSNDDGSYVFKLEEYKSLGQKMAKAGLNTVMSMSIVFVVLIFIALIISCFKLIGTVGKKETTVSEPVAAPVIQETNEEENLMDDLELVAVITAAIAAASETESTDGLVVRSIVRR